MGSRQTPSHRTQGPALLNPNKINHLAIGYARIEKSYSFICYVKSHTGMIKRRKKMLTCDLNRVECIATGNVGTRFLKPID